MQYNPIQYSVTTYSSRYNIKPSFIQELYEMGLIELQKEKEEYYIIEDQLAQLDRFARLHRDLNINAAGMEVVEELLSRISDLKEKMRILESKVSLLRDID